LIERRMGLLANRSLKQLEDADRYHKRYGDKDQQKKRLRPVRSMFLILGIRMTPKKGITRERVPQADQASAGGWFLMLWFAHDGSTRLSMRLSVVRVCMAKAPDARCAFPIRDIASINVEEWKSSACPASPASARGRT
jgi:hypothetical protein